MPKVVIVAIMENKEKVIQEVHVSQSLYDDKEALIALAKGFEDGMRCKNCNRVVVDGGGHTEDCESK